MIYFVQSDRGGPVKIGYTSDVRTRLPDLQCGCPFPLRLVAVVDGGPADEREWHRRFAGDREHGEWFRPSARLERAIGQRRIKERIELSAMPAFEEPALSIPADLWLGPLLRSEQALVDRLVAERGWRTARELSTAVPEFDGLGASRVASMCGRLHRRGYLRRDYRWLEDRRDPVVLWAIALHVLEPSARPQATPTIVVTPADDQAAEAILDVLRVFYTEHGRPPRQQDLARFAELPSNRMLRRYFGGLRSALINARLPVTSSGPPRDRGGTSSEGLIASGR